MRLRSLLSGAGTALLAAAASGAPAGGPPVRPRVVVVGWDGADWSLLAPMMRDGKMPELAKLVSTGRTWDLATFEPMASPLIWTTVATGRTPVDHGVADFQERDPDSGLLLPVTGRSRKVPAIWNVASARGLKVGVVGWWATWPAEKVNGFLVSDRLAPVLFDVEALSRSSALAYPESLSDGARIVLKREGSPSFEEVARGLAVTRAEFDAAVAARKDLAEPVTGFRKILGATRATAKVATELYDRESPDLLMVYLQGTDEIGHVLGRYVPPALPGVSEADARRYGRGVEALYAEADRLLGELMRRAERDGATLMLLSDHGFRWGGDRPTIREGGLVETAFLWHRAPGILVASGPEVVPSAERGKASVFDIAPTLARLLGLPPDPSFEGRPLAGLRPRAAPGPAEGVGVVRPGRAARPVPRGCGRTEDRRRVHEEADLPRLPDRVRGGGGRKSRGAEGGDRDADRPLEPRDVPPRPRKAGRGDPLVPPLARTEPEEPEDLDQPLAGSLRARAVRRCRRRPPGRPPERLPRPRRGGRAPERGLRLPGRPGALARRDAARLPERGRGGAPREPQSPACARRGPLRGEGLRRGGGGVRRRRFEGAGRREEPERPRARSLLRGPAPGGAARAPAVARIETRPARDPAGALDDRRRRGAGALTAPTGRARSSQVKAFSKDVGWIFMAPLYGPSNSAAR